MPYILLSVVIAVNLSRTFCMRKISFACANLKHTLWANVWINLFAAIFSLAVALCQGALVFTDKVTLLTALLCAACLFICNLASMFAYRLGTVALTDVSTNASLLISCAAGWIFFRDNFMLVSLFAVFVLVVGMTLMTLDRKYTGGLSAALLLACALTFAGNGVLMIGQRLFTYYPSAGNIGSFNFFMFGFTVLFSLAMLPFGGKAEPFPFRKTVLPIVGESGGLTAVACLMTYLSGQLPAAILYPISCGLTIALNYILSRTAYREKGGVRGLIGIVLVIASLVALNLF